MIKAFLVQDNPKLNMLAVNKFAAWPPRVIFPPGQVMLSPEKALRHARNVLEQEMNEDDFLIMIGDPIMIAFVALAASELFDTLKFLKWDRQEKMYYPIEVEVYTRKENVN